MTKCDGIINHDGLQSDKVQGQTIQEVLLQLCMESLSQNTTTVIQKEMLNHFIWDLIQILMLQINRYKIFISWLNSNL